MNNCAGHEGTFLPDRQPKENSPVVWGDHLGNRNPQMFPRTWLVAAILSWFQDVDFVVLAGP